MNIKLLIILLCPMLSYCAARIETTESKESEIIAKDDSKGAPKREAEVICHSCIKFEDRDISIAKSKLFKVVLDARDQKTPGRLFLETHEHIPSLSAWTDEHWVEFGKFLKIIQIALKEAFDPLEENKLINVECKMNLAKPGATHTHFHILPRYRNPITLTDPETGEVHIFEDKFYGKPYDFNPQNYKSLKPSMLKFIIKKIQEKLNFTELPQGALKKELLYTVGIKLPNKSYSASTINPLHMTITYLGSADLATLEKAKQYLKIIKNMGTIKLVLDRADTFGDGNHPIPVRLLRFLDLAQEKIFIAMHAELGQCEPNMPRKLEKPNWHISLKDEKLRNEFFSEAEGFALDGAELFIKPLGPLDPIFIL